MLCLVNYIHSIVVSRCVKYPLKQVQIILEIFFYHTSVSWRGTTGSIGPGGKPLGMCRHVQACASMCEIYTCGSNVV